MLQRHPLDTPEALLGCERWEHPFIFYDDDTGISTGGCTFPVGESSLGIVL